MRSGPGTKVLTGRAIAPNWSGPRPHSLTSEEGIDVGEGGAGRQTDIERQYPCDFGMRVYNS